METSRRGPIAGASRATCERKHVGAVIVRDKIILDPRSAALRRGRPRTVALFQEEPKR